MENITHFFHSIRLLYVVRDLWKPQSKIKSNLKIFLPHMPSLFLLSFLNATPIVPFTWQINFTFLFFYLCLGCTLYYILFNILIVENVLVLLHGRHLVNTGPSLHAASLHSTFHDCEHGLQSALNSKIFQPGDSWWTKRRRSIMLYTYI